MLSKLFDADKDGKLNEAEKKNALNAIKHGFENKFIWNIDKSGPERKIRILQKRGVIVEADDFKVLGKTYPKLGMSSSNPKISTGQELKDARKQVLQETLKQTKKEWDKFNPSTVEQKYILSEYLIDKPTHNSIQQIKDEKFQTAREQNGLNALPSSDINKEPSNIGINYVEQPKYKTKSEMSQYKKDQNVYLITKLHELSSNSQHAHVDPNKRLSIREDSVTYLLDFESKL